MPMVPCFQCRTEISDIAESCPQCGHPQPKHPSFKGVPGAPCKQCSTYNLLYFEGSHYCRKCRVHLREGNEQEFLNYEAKQVFANSIKVQQTIFGWLMFVLWIVSLFFFGLHVTIVGMIYLAVPPLFLITYGIYQAIGLVTSLIIRRNGFRNWYSLRSEYAWKYGPEWLRKAYDVKLTIRQRWECLASILVLPIGITIVAFAFSQLYARQEEAKKAEAKKVQVNQLLMHTVELSTRNGLLESELQLYINPIPRSINSPGGIPISVSPQNLTKCDLAITVTFENGKMETFTRYWESWRVGETKSVTFPSQGKIQRTQVKGMVYNENGLARQNVDLVFTSGFPLP
jgi:hypothetical protein